VGRTILVVDDDTNIQATLRALLEDEGYEVVVARDGVDALARLEGVQPALILLDLMMPRMDGYTFAAELQRRGLHPGIPIVVLTAGASARQAAARLGAAGYAEKPFSINGLLDTVDRLAPP
jgi:chemosensory pili system protein ChpA (sensor histidine kinase/response regulator)